MADDEPVTSASLDAYARKYMTAGETVLGFHKQVSRVMLYALGVGVLGGVGAVIIQSISAGRAINFAALVVTFVIVGLYSLLLSAFFGVTRVLVTNKFVRINLGIAAPEIPLDAIVAVKATDVVYPVGVRPWGSYTTYHSGGGTGSVEIDWKKPDGTTYKSIVCLSDPTLCAADIQRALGQRSGGVRVDAAVASDSLTEQEVPVSAPASQGSRASE